MAFWGKPVVGVRADVELRSAWVTGEGQYMFVAQTEKVGAAAVLAPLGEPASLVEGMQIFPMSEVCGGK